LNGHVREYLNIRIRGRILHTRILKTGFEEQVLQRLVRHMEYEDRFIQTDVLPLRDLEADYDNRTVVVDDKPAKKVSITDIPEEPIRDDI
jgi:hypothetical protein